MSGPGLEDNSVITKFVNGATSTATIELSKPVVNVLADSATVYTFSPTQERYLTIPNNLAIMETDPVESDLEIFWETTTEGLITELNQAILGGTADSVSISGFNTDLFKESLAPGGKMLTTPFSLKDQFGNTITYAVTSPAQLQLISVEDFNGDNVTSSFELVDPCLLYTSDAADE